MCMHCRVYTYFSMQVCIQRLEGLLHSCSVCIIRLFEQLELFLHQRKMRPHRFYFLTEKQRISMHSISVNSVTLGVNLHLILCLLTDAFWVLTIYINIYHSYISYMFLMISTKLIV